MATQTELRPNSDRTQDDLMVSVEDSRKKHANIRSAAAQKALDLFDAVDDPKLKLAVLKVLATLAGPAPKRTMRAKKSKTALAAAQVFGSKPRSDTGN